MELPGVRKLYKRYGRYLDHRRVRAGLRKVHVVSEERLEQMCEDAWRWQSQNPEGYRG